MKYIDKSIFRDIYGIFILYLIIVLISAGNCYAANNNVAAVDATKVFGYLPFAVETHFVKAGETLETIARHYNITSADLRRLNNWRDELTHLHEGMSVVVPIKALSNKQEKDYDKNRYYAKVTGAKLITSLHNNRQLPIIEDSRSIQASSAVHTKDNNIIDWSRQYGTITARVNFDYTNRLNFDSELGALIPLYNHGNGLLFSQDAMHNNDGSFQINIGLGARYFSNNYIVGINGFFDRAIFAEKSRIGFGAEYWLNYLRLHANGYLTVGELSNRTQETQSAHTLSGFDIAIATYLPELPQLGFSGAFAKYFSDMPRDAGTNDTIFSKHSSYYALSIDIMPIPLLSINLTHKIASGTAFHETTLRANVAYRFGIPFRKQIMPSEVKNLRSLNGSRYDLIKRNNIIFAYTKSTINRLSN